MIFLARCHIILFIKVSSSEKFEGSFIESTIEKPINCKTIHIKNSWIWKEKFINPFNSKYLEWYSPYLDLEHTIQVCRGERVNTTFNLNEGSQVFKGGLYCKCDIIVNILWQIIHKFTTLAALQKFTWNRLDIFSDAHENDLYLCYICY